jgi:PAS domain S-box-containing protein
MSSPSSEQTNAIREIQRTREVAQQAATALSAQRDVLRQRGMNLPPQVMSTLQGIDADLKRLEEYLYEEQTELGQLRALANMSAAVTTSLDIDVVLNEAMDIVIALTKAERGYIVLVDRETGTLEFRVIREDSLNPMRGGTPQISSTVLQEVLSTRQPLLADNAFRDERLLGGASVANFALRSVLCVPLMFKDDMIGVVYVDNRLQSGVFTPRELNLLTAFANTAAVAISNAMFYASIQNLLSEITQVKDLMDNIFASIASGVIATDSDGVITTFNRAAQDMLAVKAESSISQPITTVLPRLIVGLEEQLEDVRQSRQGQTFESELFVEDRGRVALTIKLNPLRDSHDTVQGVALVLDDVTQQREREQQLNTIKTYLPPEMVDNIATISGLALGGESREVTCVFAEVRSLYTMRDIHPREILEILNEYFGLATDAINAHQGIVDKYMGTEIMALFNTQLNPVDNHAARALDAALSLRDRFVELYRRKGINPQPHYYRVGMHTGVCTLGNVGSLSRRDFTAIGDTINLAKRVEENTPFGAIIISEGTRQHIAATTGLAGYRLGDPHELKAKGREETTIVYEVFRA